MNRRGFVKRLAIGAACAPVIAKAAAKPKTPTTGCLEINGGTRISKDVYVGSKINMPTIPRSPKGLEPGTWWADKNGIVRIV